MKQPPKFIRAVDEKTGRIFIFRTRNPAYFGEVFEFDNEIKALELSVNYPCGSRAWHNGKHYVFILNRFLDPIDKPETQTEADELARLLRRAIDWYIQAIIKKEDLE